MAGPYFGAGSVRLAVYDMTENLTILARAAWGERGGSD